MAKRIYAVRYTVNMLSKEEFLSMATESFRERDDAEEARTDTGRSDPGIRVFENRNMVGILYTHNDVTKKIYFDMEKSEVSIHVYSDSTDQADDRLSSILEEFLYIETERYKWQDKEPDRFEEYFGTNNSDEINDDSADTEKEIAALRRELTSAKKELSMAREENYLLKEDNKRLQTLSGSRSNNSERTLLKYGNEQEHYPFEIGGIIYDVLQTKYESQNKDTREAIVLNDILQANKHLRGIRFGMFQQIKQCFNKKDPVQILSQLFRLGYKSKTGGSGHAMIVFGDDKRLTFPLSMTPSDHGHGTQNAYTEFKNKYL